MFVLAVTRNIAVIQIVEVTKDMSTLLRMSMDNQTHVVICIIETRDIPIKPNDMFALMINCSGHKACVSNVAINMHHIPRNVLYQRLNRHLIHCLASCKMVTDYFQMVINRHQ